VFPPPHVTRLDPGDLHEGLRCFLSGAFFEAHEHWESVWLGAQEPERTFLQGLIQVAASFHHFQRGNFAGTTSLLRSALRRLDSYPTVFPAARRQTPTGGKRVTFLTARFSVQARL
jgi:predicted metal-dependent hydrolase